MINTIKDGFKVKEYARPVKRYCQTLKLKDNPELIREYKQCHSKEKHWKIIRDGIKKAGILEMEIYITDNTLFMIVETPLDFNWEKAMAKLATMEKQEEWESFVSKYQKSSPNATSAEKWKLMDRMFFLYD